MQSFSDGKTVVFYGRVGIFTQGLAGGKAKDVRRIASDVAMDGFVTSMYLKQL